MVFVLSLLIRSAIWPTIFPKLMAGGVLVCAMNARRWIRHLDLSSVMLDKVEIGVYIDETFH
jgi:hypothetical protein